jgi:probable rRNA maturation factor
MSYSAHVRGGPEHKRYAQLIQHSAEEALHQSNAAPCDVSIALVDEPEMRRLNLSYAGEDHATDVLSFESGITDPDSNRLVLGDIVICLPIAQSQAELAEHTLEDELALLTVHGVLHLLGFDHAGVDDQRRMWDRQNAILGELGRSTGGPPEAG